MTMVYLMFISEMNHFFNVYVLSGYCGYGFKKNPKIFNEVLTWKPGNWTIPYTLIVLTGKHTWKYSKQLFTQH